MKTVNKAPGQYGMIALLTALGLCSLLLCAYGVYIVKDYDGWAVAVVLVCIFATAQVSSSLLMAAWRIYKYLPRLWKQGYFKAIDVQRAWPAYRRKRR